MDSASEEIYLQKIEEYVYDEGKLVSFLTLKFFLVYSVKFNELYIKIFKKVDAESGYFLIVMPHFCTHKNNTNIVGDM